MYYQVGTKESSMVEECEVPLRALPNGRKGWNEPESFRGTVCVFFFSSASFWSFIGLRLVFGLAAFGV